MHIRACRESSPGEGVSESVVDQEVQKSSTALTTAPAGYLVEPRMITVGSETEEFCETEQVRCSACGYTAETRLDTILIPSTRGLKPWKRCSACQAYFLVESYMPRQEVTHTEKTSWGKSDTGKELNRFKKRMFLSVIGLLKRYCPPPASLLDVGCSYGGFLMEASKAGYQVRGFDIVPEAVKYVNSQGIPAEMSFSISELDSVDDSSLDVVTCLDCNYYWPDQISELSNAYAKLKPGGYLVMRVVDKSWLLSFGLSLRKLSGKAGERVIRAAVNDHRFAMPLRSLLKVIRKRGFEVEYASPRGALHSDQTRPLVKLSFAFGTALWEAGRLVFLAPAALILATKPR